MRKFLSIFLALTMTLSLLPTFAMAEEAASSESGNVAAVSAAAVRFARAGQSK